MRPVSSREAETGSRSLRAAAGPLALLVVSAIGILAVFWGRFVADPGIEVTLFDAGPIETFAIGEVVAFPERDLYVIGLEDGRIRAIDGRVEFSGCSVDYLPDDPRGRERNPTGSAGVLVDPCSGAVWSVAGDAIARVDEPLRTPRVSFPRDASGIVHVSVEVITVGGD